MATFQRPAGAKMKAYQSPPAGHSHACAWPQPASASARCVGTAPIPPLQCRASVTWDMHAAAPARCAPEVERMSQQAMLWAGCHAHGLREAASAVRRISPVALSPQPGAVCPSTAWLHRQGQTGSLWEHQLWGLRPNSARLGLDWPAQRLRLWWSVGSKLG